MVSWAIGVLGQEECQEVVSWAKRSAMSWLGGIVGWEDFLEEVALQRGLQGRFR